MQNASAVQCKQCKFKSFSTSLKFDILDDKNKQKRQRRKYSVVPSDPLWRQLRVLISCCKEKLHDYFKVSNTFDPIDNWYSVTLSWWSRKLHMVTLNETSRMYTIYISNEISNQSSKEIPWKLQSLRSNKNCTAWSNWTVTFVPISQKRERKKVSMMQTIAEHFTEKVE